ncbi:MAG: NADH-ubiquinone oxidoreductase-F iron-sulfur binding region domain-containing protein, partial [Victivallaceae bacterium]
AVEHCRENGLLGSNILGSGLAFDLEVVEGAGAFVCGEETALIASLEGRRGMPSLRPPYPAESGFEGFPTLVNNVETFASIPWIVANGAESFSRYGTSRSRGTKTFALAGKIKRGGLIEAPMGMTIREIVEKIGGGVPAGTFKAVQIGGPSGGCIPASLADTPVDYEALKKLDAIMGSGGMVVLDRSDCMVDIARYFLSFTRRESCGKCTFCRIGTVCMLEILEKLCAGKGVKGDLEELERLAGMIKLGSICGLGRTAPNPVLSTLRFFRDEYEAHIAGKCPAGKCKNLITFEINDDCIGCTICAQNCAVNAIEFKPYRKQRIDQGKCVKCGVCRKLCPQHAVEVR